MSTNTQRSRVYDSRTMGAAVREFRRKAGLTQTQLAEQAGIGRPYLSRLENGLETEQLRQLLAVLRTLDLQIIIEPKQ